MKREPENHPNNRIRELALEAHKQLNSRNTDAAFEHVSEGLAMSARAHVELGEGAMSALVAATLAVVEHGYWQALLTRLPELMPPPRGLAIAGVAIELVRGHCLRRAGELERAADAYAAAQGYSHPVGPLHAALELHAAHTQRLLGHYGYAVSVYERVAQAPCPSANERTMLAAKRARADSLMVLGRFREAMAILDTLIGAAPDNALWDVQTHRVRAHVLRFNFRLDEALHLYNECLGVAERADARALHGELLTDIARTRCWQDPKAALADAERAIQAGDADGVAIEVGKALAAQAIAQAGAGDPNSAKVAAEVAMGKLGATGYRSGELFALLAKGVALAAANDRAGVGHVATAMHSISTSHDGAYDFLSTPLHVWAGTRMACEPDWLDGETHVRMADCLNQLQLTRPNAKVPAATSEA